MNHQSSNDETLCNLSWHKNSAVEITPDMTISEQLQAARLDWDVELSETYYKVDGEIFKAPVQTAFRTTDNAFIDHYRTRKPWQNYDIVKVFNSFCEQAHLQLTHLGFLQDTWSLFAAAPLPELMAPAQEKNDLTKGYLLLEDSHQNRRGLKVSLFANRLICTNGQKIPIRLGQTILSHVGQFNQAKVERILNAARNAATERTQLMTDLASVNIEYAEAMAHLIKSFGTPGIPLEEQPRVVRTALRLFNGDLDNKQNFLSTYNTAWGLLQSVTEYYNHHAIEKGSASSQFTSLLNGSRASQMTKFEKQLVSVHIR